MAALASARLGTNLNAKIDQIAAGLDSKIDKRAAELDARMEVRLAEQTADLRQDFRGVERRIAAARTDLIKWTFVFWATTGLIVFGLMGRFL